MSRAAYPDLIQALSNFSTTSFTELQAAAYIALLELGEETGSAVASAAGINRSKIYDILNQLKDMKAVQEVSRDGKKKYIAVTPDDLLPELVEKFRQDIEKARSALNTIKNMEEEVDPVKFTFASLELNDLDVNNYDYLISSNEKSRVMFAEKLEKSNRPGADVKILNLNDNRPLRGLILLINKQEAFLFGTPVGVKVEAIHITSTEIANFLLGVIESQWKTDLPVAVSDEVEAGTRNALMIEKALYVHYQFYAKDQEYKYERPITLLISDEHMSFFYEGQEELKIPLQFLSNIDISEDNYIRISFANPKNNMILGELQMKIVGNPYYMKNVLLLIQKLNS